MKSSFWPMCGSASGRRDRQGRMLSRLSTATRAMNAESFRSRTEHNRFLLATPRNDPVRPRHSVDALLTMELSMFMRTKTRTVHFDAPFTLKGLEGTHPAGDYQVQDDEEQITGISWLAYRRVATLIEVVAGKKTSMFDIDPSDLETALDNDRARSANHN